MDDVLHLHCVQHEQLLAAPHEVALVHVDADDRRLHWRTNSHRSFGSAQIIGR